MSASALVPSTPAALSPIVKKEEEERKPSALGSVPPSGPKAKVQQQPQAPPPPPVPMTDEERWAMEFEQIPAVRSERRDKILARDVRSYISLFLISFTNSIRST